MTIRELIKRDSRASETDGPAPEDHEAQAALTVRRERLLERFALLQAELGGVFYEMVRRDHVRMDVLTARAAALQDLDAELAEVDMLIARSRNSAASHAPDRR